MGLMVTPMEWVKVSCNILDHRKIKIIRSGPEGNTIFLLWLLILTEAGKCNRGGYLMISDDLPYSEETVSTLTGIALSTVRLGLIAFAKLGMIDRNDGAIFIKNWRKYQSEDKLEARREKERIRQQRHRAREREKMKALPSPEKVSRDSETLLSRDVTLENRQDKKRIEKTTTEKALSLFSGTPFTKVSKRELKSLEKRHGPDRLLLAADVAAETWRRDHEERHNPGGYLNSLCCSLVLPDWYVPFEERFKWDQEKKVREVEASSKDEQKTIALEALWASLSDEAREKYVEKASADLPKVIRASPEVIMILAKSLAWEETRGRSHEPDP
jgi:predicted phage replisome organizer